MALLKYHPVMSYRGIASWPPVWVRSSSSPSKVIAGEVGVLTDVHWSADLPRRCFLTIEFQGESYLGTLLIDDVSFARQIAELLRTHLGRPIKEIGELDLSATF